MELAREVLDKATTESEEDWGKHAQKRLASRKTSSDLLTSTSNYSKRYRVELDRAYNTPYPRGMGKRNGDIRTSPTTFLSSAPLH